ncbi:MAG TPA: DinB family protein [Streptosporangiaceae bacterium]|nr:DinB family protein [Streptosporangiaceae bacterium]
MANSDQKADLHRYLQEGRDALLWKLDGLDEYDIRRPMVPTGTSLLGLVKHLAHVELGYFGDTFSRPSADKLPWDASDPNSDMFAAAGESREFITGLYRRAWAHADATIDTLALDATGRVPWWPPGRNEVTLHRILVHVIAETCQHAGHADIIRELIDGASGLSAERPNLPSEDPAWWAAYRDRVERAAREAAARGAT